MAAMLPPFSVPVYEPLPYALSGLTFLDLPIRTQLYLTDAKLVPPHTRGVNSIEDERSRISIALFRCLTGTDIALVNMRHEAVAMARYLAEDTSPRAHWHAEAQETRLKEVLGVLLPERKLHFKEYMIKFDALVWLDQQGRENYTLEDWQRHRDALLKPILDHTSHALVALDESVTRRTAANGYAN
ncbi:uncharacterized protein EDB91DRAFT_1105478 [Suillus paluster]|uniref:uncharacterized protein n=1 Tax=Suillus paluster TaxID=48578 RepID=UPI001B85F835|nr:uncharacterized protein EDB91DRAFT_1105478 [Suillus paluster]KAG1751430.1 hypothetical protein EDB91DRAFT_1105478 [Suillus paluster]